MSDARSHFEAEISDFIFRKDIPTIMDNRYTSMSRIASVLFGQPLWPCLVRARLTFGIFAVCYDGFSDDQPRSHEARPRCESWISDLRFDGDEPSPLRKPVLRFPVLVQMGHLKPLGKPAQNSRKWFATAEIERLSRDLAHCCPVNLLLKRTGSLIALTIVNVSGVTDMELGEAFLRSS